MHGEYIGTHIICILVRYYGFIQIRKYTHSVRTYVSIMCSTITVNIKHLVAIYVPGHTVLLLSHLMKERSELLTVATSCRMILEVLGPIAQLNLGTCPS